MPDKQHIAAIVQEPIL